MSIPSYTGWYSLIQVYQLLLKGTLFVGVEPTPMRVHAVRIPGGLTPP